MPVITIARQFGAGGEAVGQMVAQRLGANLLDRGIMDEVARRLDIPTAEVEARDEHPEGFLNQLLTALGSASLDVGGPGEVAAWNPPYADPAFDSSKAVLALTKQVILEAAHTGNAVIVGRGAAYVLREEPGVLNVFLQAPTAFRLAYVQQLFGVGEDEARRRLKQTDANRGAYIRQVYGHDWQGPAHYDVVVDTARLGFEGAAEVIVAASGALDAAPAAPGVGPSAPGAPPSPPR